MIPVPSGVRVWLAVGRTDMRRGMNGLALQVQEALGRDPHAGDLYVFRGAKGNRATYCILCSEAGEPEGLILLEALVKLGSAADNFPDACPDGLGVERGDGDLPGRRLDALR